MWLEAVTLFDSGIEDYDRCLVVLLAVQEPNFTIVAADRAETASEHANNANLLL